MEKTWFKELFWIRCECGVYFSTVWIFISFKSCYVVDMAVSPEPDDGCRGDARAVHCPPHHGAAGRLLVGGPGGGARQPGPQ